MSLPGKILRKIRSLGTQPFNLALQDRATWPEGNVIFQSALQDPQDQWIYHSQYQDPAELTFENGLMHFEVKAASADEWAYIYLDPQKYAWSNYSWQMRFRRMTPFQEYAFNFRYVDFDNRYRYRFEDDLLFFDSKVRGKWRGHARMPFPMAMGAWYDLRIDTRGDRHRCYINGMLMMENRHSSIRHGSISIILWEIDGVTDCVAEVGPSTVKQLS